LTESAELQIDSRNAPLPSHAVYGISVAAELSGAPIQSLRLWERHGLLTPARSDGGTRRYSVDDLDRIARIVSLVVAGVNIAGIGRILELEDDNAALRAKGCQAT
jgi:DNA-binding transcriptional MerR regulator